MQLSLNGHKYMADHEAATNEDTGYEPDFVLSHRDVIHEENWPEYETQGFFMGFNVDHIDEASQDDVLVGLFNAAKATWGVENVYTGDAWSDEDGRPLHHKPGVGIYVHPDGRAHLANLKAEWSQRRDQAASAA
jgi:hypothetical protein